MKTKESYYLILFVYISLWSSEVIACHLTHSLIILVDSYINLYKILDISLGILHLKTQTQIKDRINKNEDTKMTSQKIDLATQVFNKTCTYQFKRLPLLGSFINGLFLAALLMSAAIEGIQTCFHASHSSDGQKSILLEDPITYPGILIGFGLIGIAMQWCSSQAHSMREEELESESLLDIRRKFATDKSFEELDVQRYSSDSKSPENLQKMKVASLSGVKQNNSQIDLEKNEINSENRGSTYFAERPQELSVRFSSSQRNRRSYELSPKQSHEDQTEISLKSLKMTSSTNSLPRNNSNSSINTISNDITDRRISRADLIITKSKHKWYYVRYFASPFALAACALIVYFINDELATEIADAGLAILVVILLFAASYPPMKRAGKVLLQSAPDGVDLAKLEQSLKSISPLIVDIKDLHVWSLTSRSNRVATCYLMFNRHNSDTEQIAKVLNEVRLRFLEQNIKCCTVQPAFIEDNPAEQENQN